MNDPEPDDTVPPLSDHQPKAVKVAELQASENNWKAWGCYSGPAPAESTQLTELCHLALRLEAECSLAGYECEVDVQSGGHTHGPPLQLIVRKKGVR